jgi:hypothetical protein
MTFELELIPTNRDSNTKKYKEMNRVTTLFNDGSIVPAAFVTVGRQRVKQYGNTVYLNNGNEFEIELFNPTQNKVLAKIDLNGLSLGSGIIIRPGERVFLERYLNEARKFLFEIYEVDANNPSVQKAIANNGDVSVKFYNEYINYNYSLTGGCSWGVYNPPLVWGSPTYTSSVSGKLNNLTSPESFQHVNFSQDFAGGQGENGTISFASVSSPKSMETGRIDKGSVSNQSFTYDNTTFDTWWSWSSEWKILPLSQRPLIQEDLKIYCTNCGMRRKKNSFKYCPNCGGKY